MLVYLIHGKANEKKLKTSVMVAGFSFGRMGVWRSATLPNQMRGSTHALLRMTEAKPTALDLSQSQVRG